MDEGQRKMESLNLTRFAAVALPRFVKMRQHFKKERIGDIAKEVRTQLAPHLTNLQGKRIAIGIGSRGIANIKEIAKTLVDELIRAGAKPLIIPTTSATFHVGPSTPASHSNNARAWINLLAWVFPRRVIASSSLRSSLVNVT